MVKMHCIVCNNDWGEGIDVESHGICPRCFAMLINEKRKFKNQIECYGKFDGNSEDCLNCFVSSLCKKDSFM